MKVYENLVIGDFLFGLGAEIALRHGTKPLARTLVGLLQQTKHDETYGDVMIKNPGVLRILEFKRQANRSAKERAKLWMIQRSLRSKAISRTEAESLTATSRQVHWYAEIPHDAPSRIRVMPYLDMRKRTRPEMLLADFVRSMADQVATGQVTENEMLNCERYLNLLAVCRPTVSTAAVVVFITKAQIHYDVVPDFQRFVNPRSHMQTEYIAYREHLALKEKVKVEEAYERVQEIRHYVAHDLRYEREHELTREALTERIRMIDL